MIDELYKGQLQKAAKFIPVYERIVEQEENDEKLITFDRGHFQCDCSEPGLTQHGIYITTAIYSLKNGDIDRIMAFVSNTEDTFWVDNSELIDSWFNGGSWKTSVGIPFTATNQVDVTEFMLENRIYVRLVEDKHINEMLSLSNLSEEPGELIALNWGSEVPGTYYDPVFFDPLNYKVNYDNMRFHGEFKYEKFMSYYGFKSNKLKSGLKLKSIPYTSKEDNEGHSSSEVNSSSQYDPHQLASAWHNFSEPSAFGPDPEPDWFSISDDSEFG